MFLRISSATLVSALCVAKVLLCSPGASAQEEKPIAFQRVNVFDGRQLLPDATVVVQNGRITSVGAEAEIPGGAEIIEGKGKTLLPGLIDCHTHTFFTGHLKQALVFGVTTQLDMLTDHRFAAQMRSQQINSLKDLPKKRQANDRADLFSAGNAVTAPGGHGTQFGLPIATIEGPQTARDFVDARLAEQSDYIKIIYEDGKAIGLKFNSISKKTMKAVVEATHRRRKLAVAHVGSRDGARDAIDAGVDGLVHLFVDQPADEALVKTAKQRKVFVIPTLTVLQGVTGVGSGASLAKDDRLSPYLTAFNVRNLQAAFTLPKSLGLKFKYAKHSALALYKAGVPVLVGTDAPNPGTSHGASIHREMELLVEAGLPPQAVLAGATSIAAQHFRLADRGRIAPDLKADLVLVEGDPTQAILHTRRIVGVWKDGRRVDRDAYQKSIAGN